MQNRTFALLLLGLTCGVLFINVTVYKFGFFWRGHQFFSVFNRISHTSLRDDSLQAVISPSVSCSGRDVELVICVPVKRDNSAKRVVIRQTWGSYGKYGGRYGVTPPTNTSSSFNNVPTKLGEIILVFFTGSPLSQSVDEEQTRLNEEAKTYGDIFQDTYIDTYENLTLKSISIIKWISKKCPNARYVVKVDDDMYLNIPLLITSLWTHADNVYSKRSHASNNTSTETYPPPFLVGYKNDGAKVIRNKKSKWYTSREAYADDTYPSYLSGTAYAMSGSAALKLYQTSLRVPLFWMEDIYITGLCAKVAQIPIIADFRFSFTKEPPHGCDFRKLISGHRYTVTQIKRIYKELNDPLLKCPSKRK
ncbi:hexosyltransferase [Elysia marginata]|uniref:Hexosyltransferase n=1 Tax=Elysia marginata TaxID=1093978 RepID=A0AAV4IFL0_9GAST|nr:hexosyltransferase [Elysia marginata]